jgi:hypothetical protein
MVVSHRTFRTPHLRFLNLKNGLNDAKSPIFLSFKIRVHFENGSGSVSLNTREEELLSDIPGKRRHLSDRFLQWRALEVCLKNQFYWSGHQKNFCKKSYWPKHLKDDREF